MKLYASIVVGLLAAMGNLSPAKAVVVFEDSFDTYADQAALEAAWAPIGCTQSGIGASCTQGASPNPPILGNLLSTDTAVSGTQSLLNHSAVGSPGSGDASMRNQKIIPATPTLAINDKLAFSIDIYDVTPTASPNRQFASIQSSTGPGSSPIGQLIGLGFNNNQAAAASGGNFYMARVLGYIVPVGTAGQFTSDPDGGPDETVGGGTGGTFFKLNDFSTGVGTGPGSRGTVAGWHNLKAVISTSDGTNTDYNFYVDGVLSEHVKQVGAPQTYTVLRIGSGVSSASQDAYYDNFKIEYTPASAGLLGDFNNDGKVDAGDYAIWRKNDTANAVLPNDNSVGNQAGRFSLWRANFGKPPGAGSGLSAGAVPEPTSIVLLLSSLGFVFAGRRRTR